jgi:GPH family glycoside/pentoside/hexuronide:cation symporter
VMGIIFAVVIIVSLLITFWGTHERVKPEKISSEGLVATMKSILKLMEFRIVLGMFLFNMIALDLIQTLFVFFLKDVIHVPENMTFVVMGLPLVIAVAAAPLWVFLGEKLGKRKAYILSTCYFIVVLLSALFAPVYNLAFIIVLAVLSGVGISASQIIPFSIIPDIIEIDEIQHGTRREGAFYGSMMFLYKLASAMVIGLATAVLGYFGYVENSTLPQPDSAIICIRVLLGLGPGALFLISVYFVKILPITKERFDAVKRIIEERKRKSTI